MDERCEICRFFWQRELMGRTICRRFPPNASGDPLPADIRGTRWPCVSQDDWCGEFRRTVSASESQT